MFGAGRRSYRGNEGVILAEASLSGSSGRQRGRQRVRGRRVSQKTLSSVKHVASAFAGTSVSQTQENARIPMSSLTSRHRPVVAK